MKTTLIKSIITLSLKSRYGNTPLQALCMHAGVQREVATPFLNALYKEGMLTVNNYRGVLYVKPTGKAITQYPTVRPVSREVCMTVFKCIMDLQDSNAPYYNAPHAEVSKMCGHRVGVVSLDNALCKLIQAGYITSKQVSPKCMVYMVTKKGAQQYYTAVNTPVQGSVPKVHNRFKELSKEEAQQQSLLRELAQYTYIIKRHDTKLRQYPNYVFTQEDMLYYHHACDCANKLQAQLTLA